MRILAFILVVGTTIGLLVVLDSSLGPVPPIGRFLSPQEGFWQNAEPATNNFSANLNFRTLGKPANIYIDDRLVPHVFAQTEPDACFAEGWLHARFRLWQMEFQTHAAAGRLTEVLGPGPDSAYLRNDRNMRRIGMVFGAERSLEEMMKDAETKQIIEAYTAGVNAYIGSLTRSSLPLEYRLLNYLPEKWTNLKTALFLKYMSYDLSGSDNDIEYTNARSFFSPADLKRLYPLFSDSLYPIVPKGTAFPLPSVITHTPTDIDSVSNASKTAIDIHSPKTDKDNGSNNWAVSGAKTRSGRPILCNDPHLGLNLPSLWYEIQISTPEHNTYGVSFPGAPGIIIGFNDSIAWGVTNAARDVKDYYQIRFKDKTKTQYWYEGSWRSAGTKIESFRMKDGSVFYDTVAYTVFGPVMYDDSYNGNRQPKDAANLAVRWRAHDPSNEIMTFLRLDRAKNYSDYEQAIASFGCPGQNFVFASKQGDIAIWQQGRFPARWAGQGNFIMPGEDGRYRWQGDIPHAENPHIENPSSGYVSSANQLAADSSYPYYLGGSYDLYRSFTINRYLRSLSDITVNDMQKMQTDNYNALAEAALPIFLAHIDSANLNPDEKYYLSIVRNWSKYNDNDEKAVAIFTSWMNAIQQAIWGDELARQPAPYLMPEEYTLIDALRRDTSFPFIDNINTPDTESLTVEVTKCFQEIVPAMRKADNEDRLVWTRFKDAGIRHLLRMEPLSRFHLNTGGGEDVINATKQFHGPSWRMIVQLTDSTEAYGVYPGGQSGNPGSQYYDNFVDHWANGHYYPLRVMKNENDKTQNIIHRIRFTND